MTIDMHETRPHTCGGTLRIHSEQGTFHLHGTDVPVTEYFWRCDNCGEELVTEELAQRVEQEAAATYRRLERRLAPGEIQAIRERFGSTQELMERALGLGAKTWVRWESGRVMPSRSMDNLLRVIDRDPGALLHLAELHGVDLPADAAACCRRAVNWASWPKSLTRRIRQIANLEGTTVDYWLIVTVTRALDRADPLERTDSAPISTSYPAGPANEPWAAPALVDEPQLMSDGAAA